jgi:lysophospholipase L1-like esterase
MKTILCYGDSNTWGAVPLQSLELIERFGRSERWTGVLQRELGQEYEVIAEGCNGRTTVWDDPIEGYKNGKEYLIPCLDSHQPLDLVIIMLGTNDLKARFSVMPTDIAQSAGVLVDIVQRHPVQVTGAPQPQVLLIAPPPIQPEFPDFFQDMLAGGYEKSLRFSECFRKVARQFDCPLLDAGDIIESSKVDGIHFDQPQHEKLGQAVAAVVRQILNL